MKINFIKLSPTENMTVLVTDKIDRDRQAGIASKLLDYANVHAEQVGFIEMSNNPNALARLQMMGGEFCGNATMSLAAVLARNKNIRLGEKMDILLEVSGVGNLVNCEIIFLENTYIGKVEMPVPTAFRKVSLTVENKSATFDVVCFSGIEHIIVQNNMLGIPKEDFVQEIIRQAQHFSNEEAFGIMFFDEGNNYMEPIVFVKEIGFPVWEKACGTGSCAVGAYLAQQAGTDTEIEIEQPGGKITVFVRYNGKAEKMWMQGNVKIVAEGVAYIES